MAQDYKTDLQDLEKKYQEQKKILEKQNTDLADKITSNTVSIAELDDKLTKIAADIKDA